MGDYSVQQKQQIDEYRQKHNLGYVMSDEAVVSIMQKDMQKTGKVYAGFENLAAGRSNAPKTPVNTVFSGGGADSSVGLTLERTPSAEAKEPTPAQSGAIDFLKNVTGEANDIVDERDKEGGVLSATVNAWQEIFNEELAKSTIKKEIQTAKQDIELLENAAAGKAVTTSYFTGETTSTSFEEMFKKRRGVEFDEKAIADCTKKSEQFARIKTATDMINRTKEELSFATKGDVASQMNPEKSSAAIVKAFNLSGVTKAKNMNEVLKQIEEKYKDHPDIQKYGGNLRLEKNSKGQPVIMRTTSAGKDVPATNEELRIIAKEMGMRLDKTYADALGVEVPQNATAEQLSTLTQNTYDKYQKEYEASFAKAYGKKDLKILADNYVAAQQKGVANIEAGLNIASMALMIVPGGAVSASGWLLKGSVALKATQAGSKVVKGLGLVDKAKTAVRAAQTLQKVQQAASPLVMANMTLRPTELLEQLSSENGMSADEWKAWGEGVLQNSVYMGLGMGASKLAEQGAAMFKTKALVNTLKQAGKTTDEISAMIKANPVKFPKEILQSLNKVDNMAKALQVSSEVALDISSTYLANKAMGNGDLRTEDWVMSVGFALSGGVLQKQFAPLSTEAKVKYLQDAFRDIGITKEEAQNILKTMDGISSGKIRAKGDTSHPAENTAVQDRGPVLEGGVRADELNEAAPFAERALKQPQIGETVGLPATVRDKLGDRPDVDKSNIKDYMAQFDKLNEQQQEAVKILLDSGLEAETSQIFKNAASFNDKDSVQLLNRLVNIKNDEGRPEFSIDDLDLMSAMKDVFKKADLTDSELVKFKNAGIGLFLLGNQVEVLTLKGNEDLIAQFKSILQTSDKNELWNKAFSLSKDISARTTPAMLINKITDKTLQSIIKRNIGKIDDPEDQKFFINNVSRTIDLTDVKDKYMLGNISRKVAQIAEKINSTKDTKWDEVTALLSELGNYNRLNGEDAGHITNVDYNTVGHYLDYLRKEYPEEAADFEMLAAKFEELPFEKYCDFIQEQGFTGKYNQEFLDSVRNYSQEKNIQELKAFLQANYNEKADNLTPEDRSFIKKLYTDKYLSKLPQETRELCTKIYDSFVVKMFLMDENDRTSLNLVYNELLEWQKASRGSAVMPPVIDLSLIKQNYIDKTFASGGFCDSVSHNIALRGNSDYSIRHAVRHELAHANDSKISIGEGIVEVKDKDGNVIETIDIDEIIVHKWNQTIDADGTITISKELDESNLPVPDFDKCKYVDEFRNAGVSESQIEYAYTNKQEFLAVAAEGDYSKYSKEFKELLVKLGLPKWMFTMEFKEKVSTTEKTYTDSRFSKNYSPEENFAISRNTEKLFNFVAKNKDEVTAEYNKAFTIPGTTLQTRVKDFFGLNEKIYRELAKFDKKIEEVSDIDKYNREKLKPGDEPLTQAAADELIARYQAQKQRMINDYDMVYDKLQDSFGSRLVMDDTSPEAVAKVHKALLDAIDSGEFKILEINNYQGAGGVPYFSSAQIKQIKEHCRKAGYDVNIISDVNAPKGKDADYSEQFHSGKAIKESGYTTCQMNIMHKNGVVSEFQIRGKHLNELAESEHIFYDISQNKDLSKGNPKIKEITDPLVEVVKNMNAEGNEKIKQAYTNYLTECYKYARSLETGTPMQKPVLPDIVDPMLDIDNIIRIHSLIENTK